MMFDYDTFYNYYTNAINVTRDPHPPRVKFYDNNNPQYIENSAGSTYITINGTRYYITIMRRKKDMLKNGILFVLPTAIPGHSGLWGFHYHFGMKKINSNNVSKKAKNLNVVYFHKTTQNPQISNKKQDNCYFLPNQPIDTIAKIEAIDCLETKDSKMTRSTLIADLPVIQELIRRPFYGIQYGGGSKNRKCKHRTKKSNTKHPTKTRKNTR